MIIVTTEHGTKFKLDFEKNTWERSDKTGDSGNLRDEKGTFLYADGPEVGQRLTLICPPRVEGAVARAIITSLVAVIEHEL